MDAENSVEHHLIANKIPYKRNIIIKDKRNRMVLECDFVIPGAIIEVKGGNFNNGYVTAGDKLYWQIKRYRKYIPDDYDLYIFFVHQPSIDILIYIYSADPKIKIIYDLNDIHYTKYDFCTMDTGVIRSLSSDEYDDNFRSFFTTITLPKSIYYRSIVGLTNSQLANLNKIDLHFSDQFPDRYIYITGRTLNSYDVFNVFMWKIQYMNLGRKHDLLLLDGTTEWCNLCNDVKYIECIENHMCAWCSNGIVKKKRKSDLNPFLIPINSAKRRKIY